LGNLLNFRVCSGNGGEEYRPNYLCNYFNDFRVTSRGFMKLVPVLKAEPPVRSARLLLCDLTAKVLRQGLEVLGMKRSSRCEGSNS